MTSASNDTSGGEKRSSPEVDGVAIDGQKSQNSGQAVRNIEEEGGACSSTATVLITILFQKRLPLKVSFVHCIGFHVPY